MPAVIIMKWQTSTVVATLTVLRWMVALATVFADRMKALTEVVPSPFHEQSVTWSPSTVLAAPVDLTMLRKLRMLDVSVNKQFCRVNHLAVVSVKHAAIDRKLAM